MVIIISKFKVIAVLFGKAQSLFTTILPKNVFSYLLFFTEVLRYLNRLFKIDINSSTAAILGHLWTLFGVAQDNFGKFLTPFLFFYAFCVLDFMWSRSSTLASFLPSMFQKESRRVIYGFRHSMEPHLPNSSSPFLFQFFYLDLIISFF